MNTQWDRHTSSSSSGGNQLFLIGLACGAALGAVLGLLLAPRPGSELRQQVKETADQWRQKAQTAYGEATNAVSGVTARGRQAWDAGREAFNSARPGNGHAQPDSTM